MAYKFQIGDSIVSGSLTRDAGDVKVRNHAGTERASISRAGVVSGSGEASFGSVESDGEVDAGSYAIGGTDVINGSRQLQNIASLDATTEATIEAAIDTLANLASAGSNGAELEFLGSIDSAQGIKVNNVSLVTAGRAIENASSISGSGAISAASFGSDGNMTLGGNAIVAALSASAASSVLSLGVNGAAQIASDGVGTLASLTIGGQSVIDASRNATKFNNVSGSGTFNMGGTVRLDGVAAASVAKGADSFYFLDADDKLMKSQAVGDVVTALAGGGLVESGDQFEVNLGANGGIALSADALFVTASALQAANVVVGADQIMIFDAAGVAKRESLSDYATALAGPGLSATGGVLSTQAGSVTAAGDGATLAEGYNYLTGTAGGGYKLPIDASIGDVVTLKNGSGGIATLSRQSNHTIDGLNSIVLESSRGAVTMVYAVTSSWLLV
jgi:hypothetical protein